MPNIPFVSAADLQALPAIDPGASRPACCASVRALGWESLPAGFDETAFRRIGTLRNADPEAPEVLDEYHPAGTRMWSPDAPVAPRFLPYNQSELWACATCGKAFLRYAESGGYYHEDRIRELDPALVVDAPLP